MIPRALNILSGLFVIASPWVLYWTLSQGDVTVASLALVGWVIVRAIPVVLAARGARAATSGARQHVVAAWPLPAIALGFAALGWVSRNGTWLMVLPAATQSAFGLTFLRSLREMPMVEHFARIVKPALSEAEVAHCRTWTWIWGIYLIAIAAVGLVLAVCASLATWTMYVGVVSYVLVGLLFPIEYVIRKYKFRDWGRNPLDWLLSKLFSRR